MEQLLRQLSRLRAAVASDDVFVLAASIAYAAILSIFPMLIGLIVLLGRFVEAPDAKQTILATLRTYLPPSALAMVRRTLDDVIPAHATVGVLATVGWLWSATAVASALRHSLNRVLHARQARAFWRRKLLEVALIVLAGGSLSLALLASAAAAVTSALQPLATASNLIFRSRAATVIEAIGSWILSGLAFLVIYRFLPNVRLSWRGLWYGSLTAVLLFEGVRSAFFWYLRTLTNYPIVYGPLVGVVVFMIWVYLVALVVLVAAEVIAVIEQPEANRERASTLSTRNANSVGQDR